MAKPPRSEAQRAASRANGRKSKGPRSAEGKANASRNAFRHGLRATSLQLIARAANDPAGALADAVRERLAPRDVIEVELVVGIAMALWRLRRAQRLEDELLTIRHEPGQDDGLTGAFIRRASGTAPLALLLRYRSQALGELNRLLRLLEARREGDKAAAAGALASVGATDMQAAALADAPQAPPSRPANDNRTDDERRGG
jgi:hypothetical protein